MIPVCDKEGGRKEGRETAHLDENLELRGALYRNAPTYTPNICVTIIYFPFDHFGSHPIRCTYPGGVVTSSFLAAVAKVGCSVAKDGAGGEEGKGKKVKREL